MKITFDKAQQALQHVEKRRMQNGQVWIPSLLQVKGISSYLYHLKNDLKNTFESEIEQEQDLMQEASKLLPEDRSKDGFTAEEIKGMDIKQKNKDRLLEIIGELDDLRNSEKKLTFTKGRIPEPKIEDHINALQFEDLLFAIRLNKNGKETVNEDG